MLPSIWVHLKLSHLHKCNNVGVRRGFGASESQVFYGSLKIIIRSMPHEVVVKNAKSKKIR